MLKINLGYMSIADKEWSSGYFSDCDDDDDDDSEIEQKNLDPDEIIVSSPIIKIDYSYPLKSTFTFEHQTNNPKGFTRRELCEIIMKQYADIYHEEDANNGDPGTIPGMLNRRESEGPYGIWGHYIEDLMLHTLYLNNNGRYTLGVDS